MKVTDLKENEAIHCETLQQYDAICQLLHEAGYKWSSGDSYLDYNVYSTYKGNTTITPKTGEWADVDWDKSQGCIIHKATDFITPPQTKEEYAKERAIGFAMWIDENAIESNYEPAPNTKWNYKGNIVTTAELYDEYLKSINHDTRV